MTHLWLPLLVLWLIAEWRAWSAHRDFKIASALCDRAIALYEAAEADGAEADRQLARRAPQAKTVIGEGCGDRMGGRTPWACEKVKGHCGLHGTLDGNAEWGFGRDDATAAPESEEG